MVHRAIEPEDLRHMLRFRKMTHAEIAAEIGLTVWGVEQAVRRYGLSKPRISHKWAVPWQVKVEHSPSKVGKYLRDLSSIAQEKKIYESNAKTALAWAKDLVAKGLDIDYDRDYPPNDENVMGGFYSKKAEPDDWHLKMVLERALAGAARINFNPS
jgi:hypothetical protein